MSKSLLAVVFLAVCPLLPAQQALNNDAVVQLVKAGLSEELIVTTINASPGTYDTSASGLIALKQAGVSDKVVAAIVVKASGGAPASTAGAAASLPPGIDDPGVYLKDSSGAWVPMVFEIVNFQSSNRIRNIASAGIVKGDLNGHVAGSRARLNATLPFTFAVYLPEGAAITEYQLVRLHPGPDSSREFLSATGGVLRTSPGATRDAVDFQPEKIAPRLYRIVLEARNGRGEYGLLAPAAANSSNKEAFGKIYTVSVAE